MIEESVNNAILSTSFLDYRSTMKILVYNKYENRLRTVWRLLLFTTLVLFFTSVITVFISNVLNFALIAAIVELGFLLFFSSKIDKRPFQNLVSNYW